MIQKMKKGRSLATESHPIDGDQDMMNQKTRIDLEDGMNGDPGGAQTMKMRNDDTAESVMEIEIMDTRVDEREGILAAVVRMKDQEKDTITKSQLETNTVHHLQIH